MGMVQDRLRYLTLVPTLVSLPDIHSGQPLGLIWGNPRCDIRCGDLELRNCELLIRNLPVFIHIYYGVPLTCCIER